MPHTRWEQHFRKQGFRLIAGIDEAGRGPLAGPVVAAAVILPDKFKLPGLNDSKKISRRKRASLFKLIEKQAVSVGIGIVDSKTIDKMNILRATLLAMKLASDSLTPPPDMLLIDGNQRIDIGTPQMCLIKGDMICASISAASIVAKVTRDKIMDEYHKIYPQYRFDEHKGYGTRKHAEKIRLHGRSRIHRSSFRTPNPLDLERRPLINLKAGR